MLRASLTESNVYLRIGSENPAPELRSLSMVAANYGLARRNLGAVSVIGPVQHGLPARDHRRAPGGRRAVALRGRGVRRVRRDAYEVLGVERGADERAIKKAFRVVAREMHPDVNSDDPEAEAKFKEAAEAYEVLSDPERKAVYDRHGWDGIDSKGYASQAQGFGSFARHLRRVLRRRPVRRRPRRPARRCQGGDVGVEVEITLEQAARGIEVEVSYDAVEPCEHCHGNGAEPGTPIETCERCGGTGELRAVSNTAFGQLVRAQVCDVCGGEGKVAQTPCGECGGRGRRAGRKTLTVDLPAGIADGQRVRLTGPRPRRRPRRPGGRPLRQRGGGRGRALPARRERPDRRGRRARPRRGPGHHGHRADPGGRGGDTGGGRHPARHRGHAARQGHAQPWAAAAGAPATSRWCSTW